MKLEKETHDRNLCDPSILFPLRKRKKNRSLKLIFSAKFRFIVLPLLCALIVHNTNSVVSAQSLDVIQESKEQEMHTTDRHRSNNFSVGSVAKVAMILTFSFSVMRSWREDQDEL